MASIDEQLRKAIEEGKFENLPGKGKPLNLSDNPYADPEWQMAFHMLKSSGYTLPWIERRQEIEKALEEARQYLQRAWEWRKYNPKNPTSLQQVEIEWQAYLSCFRQRLGEINQHIRNYNLSVPSERFQILPIQIEREIERLLQSQETINR